MTTNATSERFKHAGEMLTGIARPSKHAFHALVRNRKPHLLRFADDGTTPNNSLPLVHYRSPLILGGDYDEAAIVERVFASNGWRHSWRDGIYRYNHFHTRTHEALGIARGWARVRFGGRDGRDIDLKAGDVVIIPAGVGHRRLTGDRNLLVVGAYPVFGAYDEPRPQDVDIAAARLSIARVKQPFSDPVYGKTGPLLEAWRAAQP